MKLTSDGKKVRIYRQDKTSQNGKAYTRYSMGVSSKDSNGEWVNGFLECTFKKGVEVQNKTDIIINNAFPVVREYNGKTFISWMITEFEIEGGVVPNENGFIDVPEGTDSELPFT